MAITFEKKGGEWRKWGGDNLPKYGEEDSGVDIKVSLGRAPVTGLSPRTGMHLCPCANNRLGVAHGKYEFGTELWWIWSMATNQGSWWCKFTALGSQASYFRGAGSFSSLTLCIVSEKSWHKTVPDTFILWLRKKSWCEES